MIGGLQGDFGDLDIKYLKQNISKCRSQISGSFRRTPRHCAKWLRNSPGKRYQRIRICLTEKIETPSFPIRICLPDVKYLDKMERHPDRIPDVGYPEKMERHPGIVRVCMVQGPIRSNSIWIPQAGIAIRINSIRISQAATRHLQTSHARTIAYPIRTRHSRSSHTRTIAYPIRICCPDHCPILLAFRICLWQRTSKLRFFMFLSFPLLCHGFQITLLNLGLIW